MALLIRPTILVGQHQDFDKSHEHCTTRLVDNGIVEWGICNLSTIGREKWQLCQPAIVGYNESVKRCILFLTQLILFFCVRPAICDFSEQGAWLFAFAPSICMQNRSPKTTLCRTFSWGASSPFYLLHDCSWGTPIMPILIDFSTD
jgi:hypothetical protein